MFDHEQVPLLATSSTPFSSNSCSHDRQDPLDLAHLPTPLEIYLSSTWTCLACNAINLFQQASALRPLGLMQCHSCGKPASFGTTIDLNSLVPIEGENFMISLPVGETGPPKTMFLWVCCGCGRSHVGRAHKVHRVREVTKDKEQKVKEELAIWLLHAVKKLAHYSEKREVDDVAVMDDGMEVRRAFKAAFHKKCKCGQLPCGNCLKFKIQVEGEWVAQEAILAVQPRFMDVMDRAALNFRNAS